MRWKGVITAVDSVTEKTCLIDIPPETGESLKAISGGKSLRGSILVFQRETANIRSRLLVDKMRDSDTPLEDIPKEIDPTPTLLKMWGLR